MNLMRSVLLLVILAGSARAQSYVKLSGPLPTLTSELEAWSVTPDGTRVVFERATGGARGVFSAPLDGGPQVALTASLPGTSQGFALTPDGSQVVVLTRPGASSARRMHVVATAGGTPVQLSGSVDVHIDSFRISPSGLHVVYHANTVAGGYELWSARLDASAPPVRLNEPLAPGRAVATGYRLSHGGLRTFYIADQDADEVYDLYSVLTDRSQPPVRLNTSQPWADVTGYELAFDSLSVVYRADQDTDGKAELYVTSTLGGFTPVRCSGALVAGGNVASFGLAAASHRLVFVADAEQDERFELYALDPTVAGARTKLSGTLASDRDVLDARVAADGQRVAYRSTQGASGQVELFGVPATGGTIVTLSSPLGAGESILGDYALESVSGRVLFHRGMGGLPSYDARQLYSAPLDGSAAAVRLNGELVERGRALLLEARAEGALFSATEEADEALLFRAPLAGGPALRLSPALPTGSSVTAARLVPGDQVVLEAGEELLVVPADGGEATPVAGSRVEGTLRYGVVQGVTASREHVAYVGVQAPARSAELFSARLDGSEAPHRLGRAATKVLQDTLFLGRDRTRVVYLVQSNGLNELCSARLGVADSEVVLDGDAEAFDGNEESVTDLALAPDGDSVVYALKSAGSLSVRRAPLDGSAPAEELASWPDAEARLFLSPDGNWVVLAGPAGLYSLPVDGHQPAQRLDAGGTAFPHVVLTFDSSRVLFSPGDGLYSAPLDGAQPTVLLGPGIIDALEFTLDGASVLFEADTDLDGGEELYHAALDGASPADWLGGTHVQMFQQDPVSGRVIFHDQASGQLVSLPLQGGGFPAILTTTFGLIPMEGRPLRIVGGRVLYRTTRNQCGSYNPVTELSSVPVAGGGAPVRLDFGTCSLGVSSRVESFGLDPSVLFVHRPSSGEARELYRIPADGSAPAGRITGPRWLNESIFSTGPDQPIELTPDGEYLLCRTEPDHTNTVELHALRLVPRARSSR